MVPSGISQSCTVCGFLDKHVDQQLIHRSADSHPVFLWPSAGALQVQVDGVLVPKLMETVSATELYSAMAFWMDMRWQLTGSLGKPLRAEYRGRRSE